MTLSLNFSDKTPCHMLGTNIEFKFSIFFKLRYILASFGFGILNEFAAKDAHFAHIVFTEKKTRLWKSNFSCLKIFGEKYKLFSYQN